MGVEILNDDEKDCDCELEIVIVDILDKKYHLYKDTNELNILFCIFKEQLIDFERLVWTDSKWGNEEEALMGNEEEDDSVTDKLKWEEEYSVDFL